MGAIASALGVGRGVPTALGTGRGVPTALGIGEGVEVFAAVGSGMLVAIGGSSVAEGGANATIAPVGWAVFVLSPCGSLGVE
jgi:hypothetical protein